MKNFKVDKPTSPDMFEVERYLYQLGLAAGNPVRKKASKKRTEVADSKTSEDPEWGFRTK